MLGLQMPDQVRGSRKSGVEYIHMKAFFAQVGTNVKNSQGNVRLSNLQLFGVLCQEITVSKEQINHRPLRLCPAVCADRRKPNSARAANRNYRQNRGVRWRPNCGRAAPAP